jgi:hypothetical protein
MAMVDADWTITRSTGNIRYIGDDHGGGSPSYATVIEFHRWLQDFADDASSSGDDELDITDLTPSDRSTDNIITLLNGYNIDDAASEHLYDGSIIQDDGDTIYDGIVNFGNADVQIQIIQNGAVLSDDWWNQAGAGLNADSNSGISHRFMLPTRRNGVDIDGRRLIGTARMFGNTYGEFKINGTSRGNNVLALVDSTDLNNQTAEGTVSGWTGISNTEGLRLIDISGDGNDEEYYSEWDIDIYSINQFYERMKWLTRDGTSSTLYGLDGEVFRGITHSFAYDGENGTPPDTAEFLVWGTAIAYDNESSGPFVVGDAIKETSSTPAWTARILAVDDNGTTGTLIVEVKSGNVANNESFASYNSSGATGTTADVDGTPSAVTGGGVMSVLAIDDDGSVGNLYVQLTKGVSPADDNILYATSNVSSLDITNNLTVNGNVTERTVSTPFIGVSTGSALIGAYGVGLEAADTQASDTFFDLSNTQITPPNNVTFTVSGLVSGEDRVLVTNDDSGAIDFDQMTLGTTLSGGTETTVNVGTGNIPDDTPSSGILRIELDDGSYRRVAFTSQDGDDEFTIGSTDFTGANEATAGNNVFIAYIDELASGTTATFTTVYDTDRTLFVRIRDGGTTPIKTFESTGVLGSSGGSATAIRTSDE